MVDYLNSTIFSSRLRIYLQVLLIGSLSFFFSACSPTKKERILAESNTNLVGLASFYQMRSENDTLLLKDYFLNPSLIDSTVFFNKTIAVVDDNIILNWVEPAPITTLKIYSADTTFSIILKKSLKQRYALILPDNGEMNEVKVKGEFNSWNQNSGLLTKNKDSWTLNLYLSPGQYQYVYVIDGIETLDPENPEKISNGMGGFNSLIIIPDNAPPQLTTQSFKKNEINIGASNTTHIIALWQNQEIEHNLLQKESGSYRIIIPNAASTTKRSFIRIIGANADKPSNDLLIPLEYGKVLSNPNNITRTDREASILYFMIIDRFKDGNPTNNHPLNIAEVHPKADFQGGDIAGITQKIKDGYFDSLGISTIWLSPIAQNPEGKYGLYPKPKTEFSAYHGYWPISFNKIDYRFGAPEELHELVETAHAHNMNVLLDFVANHVHQEHPIYKQHPEWATNLYLPDGSLNTERWDDHRLTTWFDTFLPTLDLTNPEITNILTDSAVFWINEYDLDGFRHDATKHVPEYFWRTLTRKLKTQIIVPQQKQLFQIGETYGSRELTASYINSGELDAQFDFNLYDAALQAFANPSTSFKTLATALHESEKYFGSHHVMGNISGNQDKPRFMAMADGSIRFDEDSKYAGWNREIKVIDTTAYQKLDAFMAFNLTVPGIPVIYYGDEIGMTGGNDPDNRRMMRFNNHNVNEQNTLNTIKKLAQFRKNNLALMYGDLTMLDVTDSTMVFSRNYFGSKTYIILNKANKKVSIDFTANTKELKDLNGNKTQIKNNKVAVKIPAYGFKILYNE